MPGQNLTRTEAEERAKLIAVSRYDVNLDLTQSDTTFLSTTTVKFLSAELGGNTFIDLLQPAGAVKSATLNGRNIDPADFDGTRLPLTNLASSNELTVVAECEYSHTGEGLHRFVDPVDGEVYLYSQFEVADCRRVFAVFEQPDLKAVFAFTVTAPAHWQIISNSPTPGPTVIEASATAGQRFNGAAEHGAAQWIFPDTVRMSCYLTAIIGGPYARWVDSYRSSDGRDVPLAVFTRRSMAEYMDADDILDTTKKGFEFYEHAFGVPYPYAKYDQIFVPEYNAGAMENIGAVTITEAYVFRSKPTQARVDRRAITVLHEQAHMWFGDLVTMKWWNDLWLNESFAEFMSHLAAVSNTRWTDAWTTFQSSEKSWGYRQDQLPSTHPIVADIRDLADVEVNFDGITYAKGASVLRQLVAWVGQKEFLAGVGAYLRQFAWSNATLHDLLAELERSSGRDLSGWSQQWLEEAGVTTLRPVFTTTDDGIITDFSIQQEVPPIYRQDGGPTGVTPSPRPHRIGIGGYSVDNAGAMTEDWHIETDISGKSSPVSEIYGKKQPDLLLVNNGDLTFAKLRLDAASLATAILHVGGITDPLARSLVWGGLWDAARDGEIRPRDFARLVLRHITRETSPTAVNTLLNELRTTLTFYIAPRDRHDTIVWAADVLAALVFDATADGKTADAAVTTALTTPVEPGSDTQLQLVKAFASYATTPFHLDLLEAVAHGDRVVKGLSIDTDLGWELLAALVAAGRANEDDIDKALASDNTVRGAESAAQARAALPTPEAKRVAWQQAVSDTTISNAAQRSIIAGFNEVADRTVLTPFVDEYFAGLEIAWETRSREMASNIVQGLYPSLALDTPGIDIVAKTDAWLDQLGDTTPALRRLVVECRSAAVRALRVQAIDHD